MNRQAHFAAGASPNQGPSEPYSLQQRAQAFNAQNPQAFKPNGLNQQIMPSGNGMSDKDAQRITPSGMLPDFANGSSQSTANKLVPSYGMNLQL
jgi:hypothetical protein